MLQVWKFVAAGPALALCVGGCSGTGHGVVLNGAVQVVRQDALPVPTLGDEQASLRTYRIGPLDKLDISVFGVEEMRLREIETDASGRISFPLAGSVQAAGMTADELATEIERRLRGKYIRNPQVTVNLHETVSQLVTVDGQVTRPGLYKVLADMSLTDAVASAGGLSEYASLEDVVVFRTVDGKKMAGLYNLQAIRQGRYEDPDIYPSDRVVVGDSSQRRLFDKLLQASGILATPIVVLLQQ